MVLYGDSSFIKKHTKRRSKFLDLTKKLECLLVCQHLEKGVVFCQTNKKNPNSNFFYLSIFISLHSRIQKAKIKLEEDFSDNELENFRLIEVFNKKRNKKGVHFFLVYSHKRILMFALNSKKGRINISKMIYQKIESKMEIVYCPVQKHFYVPTEDFLEIWDRTFSYKIYSIELENKIKSFLRIPEDDVIVLYDKYRYYEFDLTRLEMKKVIKNQNKANLFKSRKFLINFSHLSKYVIILI